MAQSNNSRIRRRRLYYAASLFSQAERRFNAQFVFRLRDHFDVYLPQDDGGLMTEMIKQGTTIGDASLRVFIADIGAILDCDILLAILNGHSIDEGVAFEMGFAYAHGKECYGFQTDSRQLLPYGNNPMIENSLRQVFYSIRELLEWAHQYVVKNNAKDLALRKTLPS